MALIPPLCKSCGSPFEKRNANHLRCDVCARKRENLKKKLSKAAKRQAARLAQDAICKDLEERAEETRRATAEEVNWQLMEKVEKDLLSLKNRLDRVEAFLRMEQ